MIHSGETASTQGGEFQAALIEYIRDQWGDLLGNHVDLLDEEDGLDQLALLLRSGALQRDRFGDSR